MQLTIVNYNASTRCTMEPYPVNVRTVRRTIFGARETTCTLAADPRQAHPMRRTRRVVRRTQWGQVNSLRALTEGRAEAHRWGCARRHAAAGWTPLAPYAGPPACPVAKAVSATRKQSQKRLHKQLYTKAQRAGMLKCAVHGGCHAPRLNGMSPGEVVLPHNGLAVAHPTKTPPGTLPGPASSGTLNGLHLVIQAARGGLEVAIAAHVGHARQWEDLVVAGPRRRRQQHCAHRVMPRQELRAHLRSRAHDLGPCQHRSTAFLPSHARKSARPGAA